MMKPAFLLLLLSTTLAVADTALIHDVEDLLNSLSAKDSNRPTLTLRLADLYFDESRLTGPQQAEMQRKAIAKYEDALSGTRGQFKAASGPTRLKVQFQLARLYSEGGQVTQAIPLWQELSSQNEMQEIQREATLRVAEHAENQGAFAESEKHFQRALLLCNGTDLCSYTHYRRAWLMKKQNRLDDSIAEIQLSLWDSKGQVREEALRDLVSFLGERKSDGQAEITLVEKLIEKINRQSLLADLAASFFAQGNRIAGSNVLSLVDQRSPSIKSKLRLLEEFYGQRDWDRFHRVFSEVQSITPDATIASELESEKALRRLIVQLDGERATKAEVVTDFKAAVELHLKLFPETGGEKDVLRLIQGWLAAETDPARKAASVQRWLDDTRYKFSTESKIELHETLAAIAQKTNDNNALIREMQLLSALTTDAAKKREYRYASARAQYDLKQYDACLPTFKELADIRQLSKPDKWALQSQNLALDILAQQKRYVEVSAQAAEWTASTTLKTVAEKDPAIAKELQDMTLIAEQAKFEAASTSPGPDALKTFLAFCTAKKLLPKSCDNAKVSAVQLKDESALLEVMRLQGSHQELAAEYEAAGYFKQSAELFEKQLTAKSSNEERIKVALLYELGRDNAARNTILQSVLKSLKGLKTIGDKEELYFSTLLEADLLGAEQLKLGWTAYNRARIAENLEAKGHSSKETQKALFDSVASTGAKWSAAVLGQFKALNDAQAKVKFYGARSKQLFMARLAKLKSVTDFSQKYYPGADAATKKQMLELLVDAHAALSKEIRETPMIEGLSDEQLQQIRTALDEMAKPFDDRKQEYANLLQKVSTDITTASSPASVAAAVHSIDVPEGTLHKNPNDHTALQMLQDYYQSKRQPRLASYFKGRLLNVQK